MKNKIIKTALISFLLTSSINLVSASENTFYLKPFVSGVMGDKMTSSDLPDSLKNIYSEYGANLGIGAGYNILEHVRVEGELAYVNNIEYKGTDNYDGFTPPKAVLNTISHTGWTAYLNSYVDIVNTGPVRFFLSGGLGASYLETENVPTAAQTTAVKAAKTAHAEAADADKATKLTELGTAIDAATSTEVYKQEWALAYNLGLGVSFELNENYLMDVSYKYNNYGTPGNNNADTPAAWPYDNRASHNLNLGLRFNI